MKKNHKKKKISKSLNRFIINPPISIIHAPSARSFHANKNIIFGLDH